MSNSDQVSYKRTHGLALWTAAIFIVGDLAGGGIMSLTYATSKAGWTGIALIVYVAFCAAISGVYLGKCWIILEEKYPEFREVLTRKPYATIGYYAFGGWMSTIVSILAVIIRLGAGTVFLLLSSVHAASLTHSFIPLTFCQLIPIMALLIMVPLWLGSPKDFWPIAYTAVITACLGTILLLIDMTIELHRDGTATDFRVESLDSFASSIGIIIFAFGAAVAFPNYQNDMRHKEKFPKAVVIAFIVLLIIYLPTAIMGYSIFGSSASTSILDDLSSGALISIVKVIFLVNCTSGVFIALNPVFLDLEELFYIPKQFNWKRALLRTLVLMLSIFIGESIPSFGQIMDLIGGTTMTLMAFVFPLLFYVKLNYSLKGRRTPLALVALFVLIVVSTVLGGIISTYSTVRNWAPLESACYVTKSVANSTNSSLV